MFRGGHVECARALLEANGGTFPWQQFLYTGVGEWGVESLRLFEDESRLGPFVSDGKTCITNLQALIRTVVARGDHRGLRVVLRAAESAGADADERGSALRVAVEARSVSCLRLLLVDPVPIAAWRGVALCAAARLGHLASVRLLLSPDTVGAVDPHVPLGTAATPLTLAVQGGHPTCVSVIARAEGVALDAVDPSSGRTALRAARDNGMHRCVRALQRAGGTQ